MSNLIDHAKYELERAGLFDKDSDYGGMLGEAVMKMIEVFSAEGHSGYSAEMATQIFSRLARFQNLTPITDSPDEWNEVTDMQANGKPLWQCKRNSALFSEDKGKTYYSVDDKERELKSSKSCNNLNE